MEKKKGIQSLRVWRQVSTPRTTDELIWSEKKAPQGFLSISTKEGGKQEKKEVGGCPTGEIEAINAKESN